jgi:hypothetical protein
MSNLGRTGAAVARAMATHHLERLAVALEVLAEALCAGAGGGA